MANISTRELLTPLAIIVAGIAVSGSVLWSAKQFTDVIRSAQQPPAAESTAGGPPPQPAPTADIAKVSTKGVPFIGAPDAPVVMAYWFDYQCPYCRQEEETVMPQLIDDYVKLGKLKILFKDFAFLGPDSLTAGLAARAVWEVAPDKFYEWHKAMFDHQDDENSGWGTKDDILALTKTIPGIDVAKVEQLMVDHATQYEQAIRSDGMEGNDQGVNGTPGVVIGQTLVMGAQPYQRFQALIDAALSK